MKKAELSFNVIVTAIIAVLVLVVLIIVFNTQFRELMRPITDAIKNIVGNAGEIGK